MHTLHLGKAVVVLIVDHKGVIHGEDVHMALHLTFHPLIQSYALKFQKFVGVAVNIQFALHAPQLGIARHHGEHVSLLVTVDEGLAVRHIQFLEFLMEGCHLVFRIQAGVEHWDLGKGVEVDGNGVLRTGNGEISSSHQGQVAKLGGGASLEETLDEVGALTARIGHLTIEKVAALLFVLPQLLLELVPHLFYNILTAHYQDLIEDFPVGLQAYLLPYLHGGDVKCLVAHIGDA